MGRGGAALSVSEWVGEGLLFLPPAQQQYSPKEGSNRKHWTITIGIIVIGLTWAWRFISFVNVALYVIVFCSLFRGGF